MFLALPYYSHSFAKTVHSCFLYTTQGEAEDVEFQENVYRNDCQGCYIAGMRPHGKNSSHLLIHFIILEFYQVQIIWIPIMKLYELIWHMMHSCHCLSERPRILLYFTKQSATHSICTQENFNFFKPCSSV